MTVLIVYLVGSLIAFSLIIAHDVKILGVVTVTTLLMAFLSGLLSWIGVILISLLMFSNYDVAEMVIWRKK